MESALTASLKEASQHEKDPGLSYKDFSNARLRLANTDVGQKYLSPVTFLRLSDPSTSRVPKSAFVRFVNSKVRIDRLLLQLQLYDLDRTGYLRESDIETFIFDLIPTMGGLSELPKDFHQFYVFTATRKFMFFLDPRRSGRVSIREILASKILEEFRCLSEGVGTSANWFAVDSAWNVYSRYIDMDLNSDGLLSKEEIARYPTAFLTEIAIDRLIQEHMSFQSMIDYKGYLDLVLALNNPDSEVSVRYIWKLLDIRKTGRVGFSEIQPFLKAVFNILQTVVPNSSYHLYKPQCIFREMLDSAGVSDREFLKVEDLILAAKNAIFIAHHLVDAQAFYQHDNRETSPAQPNQTS